MSVEVEGTPLTRQRLLTIFSEMGAQLAATGHIAEIAVFGGSAITLLFDYRDSTQDVDYVPVSSDLTQLKQLAETIGQREALSPNWFNDAISIFTSDVKHDVNLYGEYPFENPGLRVFTADPKYMLAMKIRAMRSSMVSHDVHDVWHLLDICGYTTVEQALQCAQDYLPHVKIPKRNQLILADIVEAKVAGQAFNQALGW